MNGDTTGGSPHPGLQLLGLLALIPIVPLGVYMFNRLYPYSLRAQLIAIEGTGTDTVYLHLSGTILSRLSHREAAYVKLPSNPSEEYPVCSAKNPLEPGRELPRGNRVPFGSSGHPLIIKVPNVPRPERQKLVDVLRAEGGHLVVKGGWRRRYPVKGKFKLTNKTVQRGKGFADDDTQEEGDSNATS